MAKVYAIYLILFYACFDMKSARMLETNATIISADYETEFANDTIDMGSHVNDTEEPLNLEKSPMRNPSDLPAVQTWNTDPSSIFGAIRDFLSVARLALLDPAHPEVTESPEQEAERMLEILENDLRDKTERLKEMEMQKRNTSDTLQSSTEVEIDDVGFVQNDNTSTGRIGLNLSSKRHNSEEIVANVSASCSSCYDDLKSCIEKCFNSHNCKDVERDARECPSPPSRLCSPFTPWSPIAQCRNHEDCQSPLLCCNDGCVNKCSIGVWKFK